MRQCALYLLVLLAACAPRPDCPPSPALPAIHQYSVPEQEEIARIHNAQPGGSLLRVVLDEWLRIHRGARADEGR
jgi:hypothetical protein